MSSTNPSDPRLLLPEWLRDGDLPVSATIEQKPAQAVAASAVVERAEAVVLDAPQTATAPAAPFSDRLSLDTRLDPGQLVSASDLPAWLGGLDRAEPGMQIQQLQTATASANPAAIEEPEPYEGIDAPEDGVIDVQINGWTMIAAALGLLILLAAALRLYLT
jgi:hypothetical protein